MTPNAEELRVARLGEGRFVSPMTGGGDRFVDESRRILVSSGSDELESMLERGQTPPSFESAGPRRLLYFSPEGLGCGIVTCGGICPGLNDVIRAIVLTAIHHYGIERILGFRYGYQGLSRGPRAEPLVLRTELVENIHEQGGTLLGSSRGPQDVSEMVDVLVERDIRVLFTIGGDGTLRGASALWREAERRGVELAVIGIPKTIDNDIEWISRSFGFATAVEEARQSIVGAHCEARGAFNGVGLVKLMGRHSGFIAAHASLANADVNFCLVPEVPFTLEGEGGFLSALERRLDARRHAVVVVAEGAGQELLAESGTTEADPSGNVRPKDIGSYLRDEIRRYFAARDKEVNVKYIDPSYIIRSLPANAIDSELCLMLGQHAVHAAMAGRTNMLVGSWNQEFTHVPIPLAVSRRRRLDPDGAVWQRVLESTGQPASMTAR